LAWTRWPGAENCLSITPRIFWKRKYPLLLSKETTVIEILEDVKPCPALIDACEQMAAHGYTIALDDFVYLPELEPLIAMASILKIRFPSFFQGGDRWIREAALPDSNLCLLAEKVETHDEFDAAREMGFELFQGYFFCKPEIHSRA
jgi:EAL and modified HD-GYP domain-containing signal transduction protein